MIFESLSIGVRDFSLQALKNEAARRGWGWFGQDCALCGGRAQGSLVCEACVGDLPWLRERSPDGAIAAFEYRFPIDRMVHRFKFGGDLAIGRWLGEQLAASVRGLETPDVIVAPPLSRRAVITRFPAPSFAALRVLLV